jgi:hypothetical protein
MSDEQLRPEDAHLLPLKPAALILCAMRGEDPERKLQVPANTVIVAAGQSGYRIRPLWCFAADELMGLSQCLSALRQAAEQHPDSQPRVGH